jgi:large subunit ribosomal protein L18
MSFKNYKRRREGKTDYAKRLAILKSRKPRLVVRKSNRSVLVQLIVFNEKGDETIACASSFDLKKFGFEGKCNSPSAYLAGFLAGKRALKKGLREFVADIGLNSPTKGSVVFSAVRGALDSGLSGVMGEVADLNRIEGKHLSEEVSKSFAVAKKKIESD